MTNSLHYYSNISKTTSFPLESPVQLIDRSPTMSQSLDWHNCMFAVSMARCDLWEISHRIVFDLLTLVYDCSPTWCLQTCSLISSEARSPAICCISYILGVRVDMPHSSPRFPLTSACLLAKSTSCQGNC